MAYEEYMGMLQPTAQDRNEALTYGLLGLGSGLLQGSTGHYGQFAPALGAGLQSGMVNYQNALQQSRGNRLNDIQLALKFEEMKRKKQEEMRRDALLSTLTPEQQKAVMLGGSEAVAKSLLPQEEKQPAMHYDAARGAWVAAPTTANPMGSVIPLQGLPVIKEKPEKAPVGYRFTSQGNMEPVPGGPADIKVQAQAQKLAEGSADVDVALTTLRDAYNRLEIGGGITSTKKGALENIPASASSSGIGQAIGRMLGTSNQSARNDIAIARPALLAALMKATGMSAKQMDSNAELKLWLSTATDPTLDVESNRRALDNIERKYIKRNIPDNSSNETIGMPPPGAVRRKK